MGLDNEYATGPHNNNPTQSMKVMQLERIRQDKKNRTLRLVALRVQNTSTEFKSGEWRREENRARLP